MRFSVRHNDVNAAPPSRTSGLYRRFSARHKRRAQELLPRLRILGPAHSKAPLRQCRVPVRKRPTIMEKRVSRSLHLPRTLHQPSGDLLSRGGYTRRRRRRWLDSNFLSRHSIRHGFRRAEDLSSPIPRILTLTQIPPNMLQQLPISTDSQLHPLLPPR